MNKKFGIVFLVYILYFSVSFASTVSQQNVILITFDGVRNIDIYKPEKYSFLKKKNYYPLGYFQSWAESQGAHFFGTPGDDKNRMWVANSSCKSLPGYTAIFSGQYVNDCKDNDCDFTRRNTILNTLVSRFADPDKIAVFASWNKLSHSFQANISSSITESIGINNTPELKSFSIMPVAFFIPKLAKALISEQRLQSMADSAEIEKHANNDLPDWEDARKDKYTWDLAYKHLEQKPAFMSVNLLDTDELAHKFVPIFKESYREEYFSSLNDYDDKLMKLVEILSKDKQYLENTSIIITTDHGRGEYSLFADHGKSIEESKDVWSIVIPSKTLRDRYNIVRSNSRYIEEIGETGYAQVDLRPTMEVLMGIQPTGIPLIKLEDKPKSLAPTYNFTMQTPSQSKWNPLSLQSFTAARQ